MRNLVRTLIRFIAISMAIRLVGMVVSRAYEGESTPADDDFKLLALLSGRVLASESASLRTGTAVAAVGGIDIDLRGATLDAGGAHISLKAYVGGIHLTVPADWKVYLEQDVVAGGVEADIPDPATLPADAPRLTIEAIARSGGIMIEAAAA